VLSESSAGSATVRLPDAPGTASGVTVTYQTHVSRARQFWRIHIPQVGYSTQASHLAQVEDAARDLVAILTDRDPRSINLEIHLELPARVRIHLERAAELRRDWYDIHAEAVGEVQAAARILHNNGVPLPEISTMLGVTHEQAGQLVSS
jgi:hypothetical protein